jgi:cytochrome c oxidase cbb3-type subunit 1
MSSVATPVAVDSAPSAQVALEERIGLATIDRSTRLPSILFLSASLIWLLIGTAFAMIASWKFHNPMFMAMVEWQTLGLARAAHLNAVIYGWATQAAMGVAFWIMARLCKRPLHHAGILYVAGAVWNIGVALGVLGILKGDSTGIEWLEMPSYATPLLFVSYALVGVWAIVTFRFNRSEHVYVSQWYILAAMFWFPWLYSIAQIMLIFEPARGTVQSLVNWWFAHNVLGLWFTPIGLATVYYMIPKVLGKPIHSYYLSVLGFWALALFYNWAGVHHLIGGPVPAWVQSAGIVASVMMVIPVTVTAINYHMTTRGSFRRVWESPTLRFVVFGALSYTLTSLIGSAMAVRSVNQITHFTHFTVGHAHHGMYAFFTMVMFGAIYYIMPRLLLREWPSSTLISVHFWGTALGITVYVVALSIGGLLQGLKLNNILLDSQGNPYPFMSIMSMTQPYLFARSIGGILISIGHVALVINFAWMLLGKKDASSSAPTLFRNPPEMKVNRA